MTKIEVGPVRYASRPRTAEEMTAAELLELARRHFAGRLGVDRVNVGVREPGMTAAVDSMELVHGAVSLGELASAEPEAELVGWLNGADRRRALAIRWSGADAYTEPPESFRVVAIVPCFNELDILPRTVEHLVKNGVEVLVLDNWSTDGSFEWADTYESEGRVEVRRYPSDRPSDTFELKAQLAVIPALASETGADWVIFNDADELRDSPWPNVTLREAIWRVQQRGFNCVNLTLIESMMTGFAGDFAGRLSPYFEPGIVSDRTQMKIWSTRLTEVDIHSSGGHVLRSADPVRVFPFNFLQRHYSYRSPEQTAFKLRSRVERQTAAERRLGWGFHYQMMNPHVRAPRQAICFDDQAFDQEWLLERLTGIGWRTELRPYGWRHRVAKALIKAGLRKR